MRSKEKIIRKLQELEELNSNLAKKGVPFTERESLAARISALKWVLCEISDEEF